MKNPLYSDKLMEHFENPRNVGSFPEGEENVISGMVGSPACGDTLKIELKINPDTEEILAPPADLALGPDVPADGSADSSWTLDWSMLSSPLIKGRTLSIISRELTPG